MEWPGSVAGAQPSRRRPATSTGERTLLRHPGRPVGPRLGPAGPANLRWTAGPRSGKDSSGSPPQASALLPADPCESPGRRASGASGQGPIGPGQARPCDRPAGRRLSLRPPRGPGVALAWPPLAAFPGTGAHRCPAPPTGTRSQNDAHRENRARNL